MSDLKHMTTDELKNLVAAANAILDKKDLAEAKALAEITKLLNGLVRNELRDYAFGDTEVYWTDESDKAVADGYFGSSCHTVRGYG